MDNFPSNRTSAKAPSDEGAGFLRSKKTGGEKFLFYFSPSDFAYSEATSLIRGRFTAAAGLGTAKAF